MTTLKDPSPDEPRDEALLARLRAAIETLEHVAADRRVLAYLSADERKRLTISSGTVFNPDGAERRRLVKATVRQRKAGRVHHDERLLSGTGIRRLRRKPVFTSPNVFPPERFESADEIGRAHV